MDKTAKQAIDRYLKWIVESIQDQRSNKFDELWYNDSCIEFYSGGGQTAVYRKGTGSEDVSGDYNAYETETKIFVGDTLVTLKGNGGTYALAVWRDGDYACSISVSEGMSENSWEALLTSGLPENQQGRSR